MRLTKAGQHDRRCGKRPATQPRDLLKWILDRPIAPGIIRHNDGNYDCRGREIIALALYQTTDCGVKRIAQRLAITTRPLRGMLQSLGLGLTPKPHSKTSGKGRRSMWGNYWREETRAQALLEAIDNAWNQHPAAIKSKRLREYYKDHEASKLRSRETAQRIYRKRKHEPAYAMKRITRNVINRICRKTKTRRRPRGRSHEFLGCDYQQSQQHIAAQFKHGMTWENHGKIWEVDHIRPLSSFDLTIEQEWMKAMHFTNLQPLLVKDNREKAGRWTTQVFDPHPAS